MKHVLESVVRKMLVAAGAYPTMLTSRPALQQLLQRLAPTETQATLTRLGPKHDGGYLVPDDLAGIHACFSPGVAAECGFERDCAIRNMQVYLADHSVDAPPVPDSNFHFIKKYVGATTQGPFLTLDDWVKLADPPLGDLILQMDIEGYEYETLLATSEHLLSRFRIIIIEFHRFHLLFSDPIFRIYSSVFEKLLSGHTCVHIHPNNHAGTERVFGIAVPKLVEFTFYRNDRITSRRPVTTLPHPLDANNVSGPPTLLDKSWFRSIG